MSALIILIIVAAIAFLLVSMYNALVTLRVRSEEAWSDIDVQLKRRHDLIPNLVETVKGYATHESDVLEKVTQARNQAVQNMASGPAAQAASENMLSQALKSVFAITESYPDLKANQNFLKLQEELASTEDKIQAARRFYNGNVRDLNTSIDTFPSNIIANMFHFQKKEFFELSDVSERENIAVKF
ncbi:LemA family protein [Candidatus Gracilibacteria bacterium]|jgi:LemA protein|nr:LemA family protein [Candidatus Gracilibacteria bacterium]